MMFTLNYTQNNNKSKTNRKNNLFQFFALKLT